MFGKNKKNSELDDNLFPISSDRPNKIKKMTPEVLTEIVEKEGGRLYAIQGLYEYSVTCLTKSKFIEMSKMITSRGENVKKTSWINWFS